MRVLLVSVWGHPPGWRKARFVAEGVGGRAFRGRAHAGVGCLPAQVLATYLAKSGLEVATLVVGFDSAVDPGGGDLRRRAVEQYLMWAEEVELQAEVVAAAGVGVHHGWRFEGTPEAVFSDVFKAVWERSEGVFQIYLDLTHAPPHLAAPVYYAAAAAAAGRGAEDKLVVVSAEAAEVEGEPCLQEAPRPPVEGTPVLRLLDSSELQSVVQRVREAASLRWLSAPGRARCSRLGRLVWLLSNGLGPLVYPGAVFEGWEPSFGPPEGPPKLEESRPVVEGRAVRYQHMRPDAAVDAALYQVWRELGHLFPGGAPLVDFLTAAAGELERRGAPRAAEALRDAAREAAQLEKTFTAVNGPDSAIWPEVWHAAERLGPPADPREYVGELAEALPQARRELEEERRRVAERGPDPRLVRDFLTRGGLAPLFIRRIDLRGGRIVKVVYDGRTVERLLKHLEQKAPPC
ncbi:CRISPR-associated protein [Pyrobaculum neutrophilum]|uniref:CRISPR-associated protein n=1 Tax=Pyrobaculum neutrophilum TaxID=70771 RepID=UPI00032266C7|nr:CRISPR-associated protein [Pyrobaculum neutrophilum]